MAAVRRVRQVLGEQHVLAVRLGAQRPRRLGGVQRDVRLQRLAGLLPAEEIHRRLPQQRQPLLLVAHVGSFTWFAPPALTAACRPPRRSAATARRGAAARRGRGPAPSPRWPRPRAPAPRPPAPAPRRSGG